MVLINLSQSNKSIILITIIVIISIITFYFYIRITFAILFKLNQIQNIWMIKPSYLKINVSSNLILPALFLIAPK
jgi:NADH:ubiquinone oxidoreductase subunit 2 (subunit N)